jgi:PQQ system protein
MATVEERSILLEKLGLDAQNKATLGKVLNTGNIGEATERPDGVMEATIRIRPDEICWDPSILVMPHGGDLEHTLINDDPAAAAVKESIDDQRRIRRCG